MPISKSGCLLIHIPKCAGTAFEVALGIADQYPEIGLKPTRTRPDLNLLFGGGLQHLTVREINYMFGGMIQSRRKFSFAVIRDPIERFASYLAWRYHRFRTELPSKPLIMNAMESGFLELENSVRDLEVFENPHQGALLTKDIQGSTYLNSTSRHLLPQSSYVFQNGEIGVQRLYRFSELQTAERELADLGHLAKSLESRMSNSHTQLFLEAISTDKRNRLRQIYHHDYALIENKDGPNEKLYI